MLAELYEKEGGMRKAIDEYVQAIDLNKKDYQSYYNVANLLSGLGKKDEAAEMLFNLLEKKKCSRCGYTIDNYLSTGLFGCENCYKVFSDNVDELLYKINGKCNHIKINEVNNKNNNLNKSNIIKNTKSEKK